MSAKQLFSCVALLLGMAACAGQHHGAAPEVQAPLEIGKLIASACRASLRAGPTAKRCPEHLAMLLADGRLTVGLGIGTRDLGAVQLPQNRRAWVSEQRCRLFGRDVLVEARLILTNEDFRNGLEECEVLFVTSHSRYGAGPVFMLEGKDKPYRMQKTPGYEIAMPESEVSGYGGQVLRRYRSELKQKTYTVFAPDGSDLDRSYALHGYQILVLSTCTSRKHFLDEIATFRKGYPTTAIFTVRASLMDMEMRVFTRLVYEVFQGSRPREIVAGLNEEYRNVCWQQIIKKRPPWKVIDRLYTLGINTVP